MQAVLLVLPEFEIIRAEAPAGPEGRARNGCGETRFGLGEAGLESFARGQGARLGGGPGAELRTARA